MFGYDGSPASERSLQAVREILVGSTARDVIRTAPCPVIVERDRKERDGGDDKAA